MNRNLESFLEEADFSFLRKDHDKITQKHKLIWENVYLPSQIKKVNENNLSNDLKEKAFNTLINRGHLLKVIHEYFNFKNFAEVGTAEGYQTFVMADHIGNKGQCYTCDIRDVRYNKYSEEFKSNCFFTLGDSSLMAQTILENKQKIDLFWVDGNHSSGGVLYDVIRLSKTQSKNCIWVFDDFNKRFGAFNEIAFLSRFGKSVSFDMGITGSGGKNTIMILEGRI
tara:strand:+ start:382 stop:1056 length:675 start_codon:yes stop_codon:yes gene_type:complete